jgi:hypothetical protein
MTEPSPKPMRWQSRSICGDMDIEDMRVITVFKLQLKGYADKKNNHHNGIFHEVMEDKVQATELRP